MGDYGNLYPFQTDQLVSESAGMGQIVIMAVIFTAFTVFAIYKAVKKKDNVPLFMLGSGLVALFNEGNFDVLVHLTQPANALYPMYWNYGQPMPLGFDLGYLGVFTLMCYAAYALLKKDPTKKGFQKLWIGIAIACLIIEIPGVQMGVYKYNGPQMLRVFGYPAYNLWINATGWLFSGLLIMVFEPVLKGWKRLLLSVIPCLAFAMSWGMCDIPIVCALNIAGMPVWGQWVLMLVSLALSLLVTHTLIRIFAKDSEERWTIPWEIY